MEVKTKRMTKLWKKSKTAWNDRKIYFDACKNVYDTDVFEVVAKARRKCYHLTVGCPFGRIKGA